MDSTNAIIQATSGGFFCYRYDTNYRVTLHLNHDIVNGIFNSAHSFSSFFLSIPSSLSVSAFLTAKVVSVIICFARSSILFPKNSPSLRVVIFLRKPCKANHYYSLCRTKAKRRDDGNVTSKKNSTSENKKSSLSESKNKND